MEDQQHVEPVAESQANRNAQVLWHPTVGAETTRLLSRSNLDDAAQDSVAAQAVGILSRCADPSQPPVDRTGLVVGYVQSGKTMSFTTVISLARDNGFPLVVLLAGTKDNLHAQTAQRLADDLAVKRPGGLSPWLLMPHPAPAEAQSVASAITTMNDPHAPEKFRRATVLTVMKNPTRLRKVRDFLQQLDQYGVDLASIPILVVDDEADQAGLNGAVAKDEQTATYQAIMELREALPHHSYVMYTATPQAPLLINLADSLSPDFVTVLDPGAAYTGGEFFFDLHRATFVKRMSSQAVDDALDPGLVDPPEDLQRALATFFLALAQLGEDPSFTLPVSMLVHPSHKTDLHGRYTNFVKALQISWEQLLKAPGPDRDDLVADRFQPAYDDLVKGGARMQPLEDLLRSMPYWMGATQVREVNAATATEAGIDWNAHPAWVLVGGNKLDRGFTVEGLAVTFMPRKIGAGQVDSVQQRARFFGYKRRYADLCRAWLSAGTADVFEHYVEHEQLLRKELKQVEEQGISLKDWTRLMLLDPSYKPTRKAVIDLQYVHGRLPGDTWVSVAKLGKVGEAGTGNMERVRRFVDGHRSAAAPDPRDPRETKHRRFSVPLRELVTDLLEPWQGHADDRVLVNQATLLLQARLDDQPDLTADIYLMDDLRERERSLRVDDVTVNNLQQGRAPKGPYPGDKVFFTDEVVSVQLHAVRVKGGGQPLVPGLSIRVPRSLAGGVLVQYQDES